MPDFPRDAGHPLDRRLLPRSLETLELRMICQLNNTLPEDIVDDLRQALSDGGGTDQRRT